jgi:uncharacterized RDD family membrane protein YckC
VNTAAATVPVAAGAFRRFAALVYDLMLLAAVLFLGTLALLPFTGGQAITPQDSGLWELLYRVYVAALALGYFGVSWTRRGQTLGMMSWKIRVERCDGTRLGWLDCLRRLAVGATLAIGAAIGSWLLRSPAGTPAWFGGCALWLPVAVNYLWLWRGGESRTLHDRLSGCRMVRLPA